jgi:hypothetical protein
MKMANFNFEITCSDESSVEKVVKFFDGNIEVSRYELRVGGEGVSLVSQEALLALLKVWAIQENIKLFVEVWPEDMDYDEAMDLGDLETFNY